MSTLPEDRGRWLTDDELHGWGEYAIGYSDRRIVVALPKSTAGLISLGLSWLEVVGIVLFFISATFFFLNNIGTNVPFWLAVGILGFRFLIILLSFIVVAQTERIQETSGTPPEIESEGRIAMADGVGVQANIKEDTLNLHFHNRSLYEVEIVVNVSVEGGSIEIPKAKRSVELPTVHKHASRVTEAQTHHDMVFNIKNASPNAGGLDEIHIHVSGTCENVDRGQTELIEEQHLIMPIEISNVGEIVSESKIYKIIDR